MKRFALALVLTLTAAGAFADPQIYVSDKQHSATIFSVRHMMSKVTGKFDDFNATINLDRAKPSASSVEFTIKAASINTGTPDRDKHLRSADFFDVEKNPEIHFKSTAIAPAQEKNLFNVTGDLTMHGVTKRVTLPVELLGFQKDPWGNERAGFQIDTKLNRKDFGINYNAALDNGGLLLGDDVTVSISLETLPKK